MGAADPETNPSRDGQRRSGPLSVYLTVRFVLWQDCGPARRSAVRTEILVFIALGKDQEEALAHLNGALACRAREERRFHTFECRPSLVLKPGHSQSQ